MLLEKKPGQDFVPMINLLLPTTLQPTFRTDPDFAPMINLLLPTTLQPTFRTDPEILRQKSIKRNGMIRYCNKLACKKCKCKCTVQKFKEADFSKDTLLKATEAKRKQLKESDKEKPKTPRTKVVKKVVRYVLHLDRNKMDNRKCLSEHPFGTMKRALGQYYFLLKGKLKVTAEMSLFCLSYNLRRAISLKGVPELVASLR